MWICPKCKRKFEKVGQMHSCHKVPVEEHFKNKKLAKEIFDSLISEIELKIGKIDIISLPCCVHLFGKYDFLAAIPKKDHLEVRFASVNPIDNPRVYASLKVTEHSYKNCVNLTSKKEVDNELMDWLKTAYHLKD